MSTTQRDLQKLDDYIAYFEELATLSKDIEHTTQRNAFYLIEDIDNYGEVLEGLRTLAKFPSLVIEYPNINVGDVSQSDNNQVQYMGALMVVYKKQGVNALEKRQLCKNSFEVIKKLFLKMRKDRRDLKLLNFNNQLVNGTKITLGDADEYHGYRFMFNIGTYFTDVHNPDDWHVPEPEEQP